MEWIVTVKLPKNSAHNPQKKVAGSCPVSGKWCTDTTGEHHTLIDDGTSVEEVYERWRKYYHVTRVEQL